MVFRIQSRTPGQHRGVEGEDKDKGKNMDKDKDVHKDNIEKDKDGGCDGGKAEAAANDSPKDEVDDKPTEICYYVRLRPGVREFLEKVAELYEVRFMIDRGSFRTLTTLLITHRGFRCGAFVSR